MAAQWSVTLCAARSGLAAKQLTPTGTVGHSRETWWWMASLSLPATSEHIADLLARLTPRPLWCLRLGTVLPGWQRRWARALVHPRPEHPATLRDDGTAVLVLDIDGAPGAVPLAEAPRDAFAEVLDRVPELRGCGFAAAVSASAGLKPGVRGKVFVPLAAPLPLSVLRRWASVVVDDTGRRLFDPAVLAPAQPIYTAAPVLRGVPDPWPRSRVLARSGPPVRLDWSRPTPPPLPPPETPCSSAILEAPEGLRRFARALVAARADALHGSVLACASALVEDLRGLPAPEVAEEARRVVETRLHAVAGAVRDEAVIAARTAPHEWRRTLRYAADRFVEREAARTALLARFLFLSGEAHVRP